MSTTEYSRVQDQSLEFVRESQQVVVDGIRAWSETVTRAVPAWQSTGWWVRPEEAVDAVFDIAEQALSTQREFARQLWSASTSVADSARQASTSAAETGASAVEQAPAAAGRTAGRPTTGRKDGKDYESMTVEQLQDEAAKADIEGRSQMNKQELVKALRKTR